MSETRWFASFRKLQEPLINPVFIMLVRVVSGKLQAPVDTWHWRREKIMFAGYHTRINEDSCQLNGD